MSATPVSQESKIFDISQSILRVPQDTAYISTSLLTRFGYSTASMVAITLPTSYWWCVVDEERVPQSRRGVENIVFGTPVFIIRLDLDEISARTQNHQLFNMKFVSKPSIPTRAKIGEYLAEDPARTPT
ncbi:MAG: hypothetical protein ABJI00_07660 [Paracoccaceae bacterium]